MGKLYMYRERIKVIQKSSLRKNNVDQMFYRRQQVSEQLIKMCDELNKLSWSSMYGSVSSL